MFMGNSLWLFEKKSVYRFIHTVRTMHLCIVVFSICLLCSFKAWHHMSIHQIPLDILCCISSLDFVVHNMFMMYHKCN
jgi:hypothetical protein